MPKTLQVYMTHSTKMATVCKDAGIPAWRDKSPGYSFETSIYEFGEWREKPYFFGWFSKKEFIVWFTLRLNGHQGGPALQLHFRDKKKEGEALVIELEKVLGKDVHFYTYV